MFSSIIFDSENQKEVSGSWSYDYSVCGKSSWRHVHSRFYSQTYCTHHSRRYSPVFLNTFDNVKLLQTVIQFYFFFFLPGKVAVFKAIVTGNPTPAVTWVRTNGEIDGERYKIVFDAISGEHQLQVKIPNSTNTVKQLSLFIIFLNISINRCPMYLWIKLMCTSVLPEMNMEKQLLRSLWTLLKVWNISLET